MQKFTLVMLFQKMLQLETMEKKTRHKRAAKEDPSPPKVKRIKVSQEHVELYNKFVVHGQKLKRAKRGQKATKDALVLYHAFFFFFIY
jgi:hypothetical protein